MTEATVKEILTHHLTAFGSNELEEILKDYTKESTVITPAGIVKGLSAIKDFFAGYFILIPTGSAFEMKQLAVTENAAYILWSSKSAVADIKIGTDTFLFEDGKIKLHTVASYTATE